MQTARTAAQSPAWEAAARRRDMPTKTDSIKTKGVHVKLDRETHANFKSQLAQHGLSMQEAFEEFARLVGSGSASANNMLLRLLKLQVKEELSTVGLNPTSQRTPRRISELDSEKLYDLISEEESDEAEVAPRTGGRYEAV